MTTGASASTAASNSKFKAWLKSTVTKGKKPSSSSTPSKLAIQSLDEEPVVEKLVQKSIVELWDEAYDELSKKNKSLVADYEAQLSKSLVAVVGPSWTLFSELGKVQRHQQMKVLLDRRIEEIAAGEWKLKYKDHELAVKDLVEPVMGVLEWAKDFVGSALESSPSGSLAWAGVCLLLPIVLNPSKQEAARLKGLEYIANIISQCRMRQDLYSRRYEGSHPNESKREFVSLHSSYRDALRTLYVKILYFQAKSVVFLSNNTVSRTAAEGVKRDDWDTMLAEIKKQDNIFKAVEEQWRDLKYDEECNLLNERHEQNMEELSAVQDEVSRVRRVILQVQQDSKRQRLLKWLASVDPSENYNSARARHVSSTGDWLVEANRSFKKWEKASNSILWLHGKAGSGKSFLSSSVIQHLERLHDSNPYTALAYFYFSFSDTAKQNTENMLRSLIVQLCGGRPDTPKSLLDLHTYEERNLQPGIEKLREVLQASMHDFEHVYLIVDALDECPLDNGEREKLLKVLRHLRTWSLANLHVLYTSRPEPDIKISLEPMFSEPESSMIDLGERQEEITKDIGTYIDDKLISSSDFKSWPPDVKRDVKKALTAKADGMFQYVALQLEGLRVAKTRTDLKAALEGLPEGLDETYNRILSNIDSHYQERAIRSLTWLAFSLRPLSLEDLAEGSIIDPKAPTAYEEDMRFFRSTDVLVFLGSLVTVTNERDLDSVWSTISSIVSSAAHSEAYSRRSSTDRSTGTHSDFDSTDISETSQGPHIIRLAHFSIKEYLVSVRIQASQCRIYSIKEKPAHIYLAEACLMRLLQFDEPEHSTIDLPLVRYALKFWDDHARWAGKDATELHSLIMEFFLSKRDPCTKWAHIFNPESGLEREYFAGHGEEEVGSPLYYASAAGLSEAVSQLLDKEVDVNRDGGRYGTALQAAAAEGHDKVIQQLLQTDTDVNKVCGQYGTALNAAVYMGYSSIVQQLLDKGADVNTSAGGNGTAIAAAASTGNVQIVQLLLKHGADVNGRRDASTDSHHTPLEKAADGGHMQIVQLLLENGAGVNVQGGFCDTALQAAAARADIEIVQLLLEKGASVNIQGGFYGTAVQAAAVRGDIEIVQLLLEKGADLNIVGDRYGTALQAAVVMGDIEIVQLLLEKGADVNIVGGDYGTAVQAAAVKGDIKMAQLLLEKGADVNIEGGYHGTAIQAAAIEGDIEIVQLLLEKGADLNIVGARYGTALQAAVVMGDIEIVQLLLEKGADVNIEGGYHGTAIQAAAIEGDIEIVQLLLEKGADMNIEGGFYGTALKAARGSGHSRLVQLLIETGAQESVI